MSMVINGESFTTFSDIWESSNLTQPEKDEIQFKIDLVGKILDARKQKGISQKKLAEMSGLKQPAIAKLEGMQATPQMDTLFRVLKPLGYTLAIVPDNQDTELSQDEIDAFQRAKEEIARGEVFTHDEVWGA
ncbi:MAG: helix-turn-helix transcriptional regulator [Lachnospiraceae bacterium]|nr:helix-turn-helix transcriptional regulator [Lachnospiraceae bacterium]